MVTKIFREKCMRFRSGLKTEITIFQLSERNSSTFSIHANRSCGVITSIVYAICRILGLETLQNYAQNTADKLNFEFSFRFVRASENWHENRNVISYIGLITICHLNVVCACTDQWNVLRDLTIHIHSVQHIQLKQMRGAPDLLF